MPSEKKLSPRRRGPTVYILMNRQNGTLYIGSTSNLRQRIRKHKCNHSSGFTSKYRLDILVYYEHHADMHTARTRERQIKKWNRAWKLKLIEEHNPAWRDLTVSAVIPAQAGTQPVNGNRLRESQMLRISCPYCAERDEPEFTYGGPSHVTRPAPNVDDATWTTYLFDRENPKGIHYERWCHTYGCRRWFNIARDTLTHEIIAVYPMGQPAPSTLSTEQMGAQIAEPQNKGGDAQTGT